MYYTASSNIMGAVSDSTVLPSSLMNSLLSNSTNGNGVVSFDNLYPAILQCFVVVGSGYITGRMGYITASQSQGIATFVSTFCLPALLFRSMCTLHFSQVNWFFLLAILIAKASVFVAVAMLTLMIKGLSNLGYAGLFAIFCTQSNDFALGYPILQALYQDTHPEYLNYIYLIAPISLLLLNPIGFTLMEIQRHSKRHSHGQNNTDHDDNANHPISDPSKGSNNYLNGSPEGNRDEMPASGEPTFCSAVLHVMKGVLLNPIVFMTAIGLIGNFIFHQTVPSILDDILAVLGNAFSACALFYLGLSMVGKVQSQIGVALVTPILLIFVKTLLLPLVTWEVVSWLQANSTASQSLSMYGFLYGTFPSAPSVVLYATQYGFAQHTVATGMVAGTFLSAPLMFVSARMMTVIVSSDMDYRTLLMNTSFDASIVGIVCCVWVLGVLVLSGRWKCVPHRYTVCLLISQMLGCIGMVAFREVNGVFGWRHYAQFITLLVGVFASRCWTAALSLSLCLLHTRSLCFVLKAQVWLVFFGFGLPVVLTGLLFLVGAKHISDTIDPSFHYGFLQTVFSAVVLGSSLVVTVVSVVVWQRKGRHQHLDLPYSPLNIQNSANVQETPDSSGSQNVLSPQHRSYQSCGSPLNCSSLNIEDIVPFPLSEEGDNKSIFSDGSFGEDHGLTAGGAAPIDERTCLLGKCTTEERLACRQRLRQYAANLEAVSLSPQDEGSLTSAEVLHKEYQSTHYLILVILLSVSMFLGLFLCIWKLFNHQASGIYIEIEFLDSVFNYGQAFLVFTVFGFDTRLIFSPVMRRYVSRHRWLYLIYVRLRRWMYGAEVVHLPKPWELDQQTQNTCRQFLTFHAPTCQKQICRDRRFRMRRYQNIFTGSELCSWLIDAGLVSDTAEAVSYGRRLLLGRVIAHITGEHHFQDSPFFYRFVYSEDVDC